MSKFLSETPRKVKTSSVPRQVKSFDLPSLRESFHSELSDSIFDEGALPNTYKGDIIADSWFPNSTLPLVPNAELLSELTGPDDQPLYDSSTKQWDSRYLPPILQKTTPRGKQRLPPGQEERELSTFMTAVMDALIRHYYRDRANSPTTSALQDPKVTSPSSPATTLPATTLPAMTPPTTRTSPATATNTTAIQVASPTSPATIPPLTTVPATTTSTAPVFDRYFRTPPAITTQVTSPTSPAMTLPAMTPPATTPPPATATSTTATHVASPTSPATIPPATTTPPVTTSSATETQVASPTSPATIPPATIPSATTSPATTTPPVTTFPSTTTSTAPISDRSFHPFPSFPGPSSASRESTLGPARRPKAEIPPRCWSSSASTRPLSGNIQIKPDSVLVRQPADGVSQDLDWADVLMTVELTSRKQTMDLTSQIECRALAMFDAQPNRAFCYSLSFHSGQYRLYMYDRAGGVHSRSYDLHESPLALLRILCAATFAPTSYLGMDDTFNCQLHPVITVDDTPYFIIAKCFSSSVIRGRATTVWFVSESVPPGNGPNNIFVVKDSWVNVERQLLEEEILDSIKDVDCVPKVVKAWTVQRGDQDDSTSLRRPQRFMSHFNRTCDHRVRRRLVLTPAGRPITHAANPLEVVTCLLDLVVAHKEIWSRQILHRDISINNAMMYEEALPDGTVRVRGLLIDFDYAIRVDELTRRAGPGDRTGTLPFVATALLRATGNDLVHTPAHDLESFVYLLCWIIIMYAGPQSQLRNDPSKNLTLEGWYEGGDTATLANVKEGCMSSGCHLDDVTEYFECLRTCALVLSTLVHQQQQYVQRQVRDACAAQANYLTGTKRPRSEEHGGDPLNHDAVISILHRTCKVLHSGKVPENADFEPLSQPYYYTKQHPTPLFSGDSEGSTGACPSTSGLHVLDFGGGRYLKRRRIRYRKMGPVQTAR